MKYATTKRLARQQYLILDKDGHEVSRFATPGIAFRWAAILDDRPSMNGPHKVVGFRAERRVA